jgi:MerR family transcriptional regulator, heat shock protein HspR
MDFDMVEMAETTYFLLKVKATGECSPYCTLTEVAYGSGLHPELIDRFIRLGLIEFVDRTPDGEMFFDAGVIPLLRRIVRLRNELGVNYAGIGVILELMSQVEALEAHIEDLETRLGR